MLQDSLAQARAELDKAEGSATELAAAIARRESMARLLQRQGRLDEQKRLLAELEELRGAQQKAHETTRSAGQWLRTLIAELVLAGRPEELFTRLQALYPVALLPVRLETRFRKDELLVRIYPDDIHADTHERDLTDVEEEAGRRFWEESWRAADDRALLEKAWAALAEGFGPYRAAWIARALEPENPGDRPASPVPDGEELPVAPVFPEVRGRADVWARVPRTRMLPDRWVALGYRGGNRVVTAWGEPVPDTLAVGPDPNATPTDDGLPFDDGMRWMVDFGEAERVGMGLRVPLTGSLASGLDRLVVLGVKASLDPAASAERLGAQLEAHHYTQGLGLVPQGTPTNNTTDEPSGFAAREPDHALSYAIERTEPLFRPGDGRDGDHLASALGIAPSVLAHVIGAGGQDQLDGFHMNRALWPATWGYYLAQMFYGIFSDEAIRAGREQFIHWVRATGPLPVIRVGEQPYGILPVTAFQRWKMDGSEGRFDEELVPFLGRLRAKWLAAVDRVPRMGRSGDPDRDLVEVLGMEERSVHFAARSFVGKEYLRNLWAFLGWRVDPTWWAIQEMLALEVLRDLQLPWRFRLSKGVYSRHAAPILRDLVEAGALSSTKPLANNYIKWLRLSGYLPLRDNIYPGGRPKTMLYLLLRHSLLLTYADSAFQFLQRYKLVTPAERREPELLDMGSKELTPTGYRHLERRLPELTGEKSLGEFLAGQSNFKGPELQELGELLESFAYLENRPTAILERLLTETLDLATHRLDAWITAYPTRRLALIRNKVPVGLYLGGYGWVENLRPAPPRKKAEPPPGEAGPVTVAPDNAGYIQTASPAHAATAAVLRSGQLSHGPTGAGERLALDLSSRRVRLALETLDGVRQGQPLGALLGYRFERGLHEGHPGLELDRYILPFREQAPLVAGKLEQTDEPMESIAANNVVDGLALARMHKAGRIPWGVDGLPSPATERAEYQACLAELGHLADQIDAVSDLITAEAVYQTMQGNPIRVGASVDAIGRGEMPPEIQVVRTPRSGVGLVHRLGILLGDPAGGPAAWPIHESLAVRAAAEPYANAWAGGLFGDPARVICHGAYVEGEAVLAARLVRLSELGLSPLDLIYMTEGSDQAALAELEQRFRLVLLSDWPVGVPTTAEIRLDYGRDPSWGPEMLSLAEFLEVVRSVRTLLLGARALDARDFALPEESATPGVDLAELAARADQAEDAFRSAYADLDVLTATGSGVDLAWVYHQNLLRLAAFGIPGTVPAVRDDMVILREQAEVGLNEARKRMKRLDSLHAGFDRAAASELEQREHDESRFKEIFGASFRVLVRFRVANATELSQTFAQSLALQAGDPQAAVTWLQRAAKVREGVARLDEASLYAVAIGAREMELQVGQLPFVPDDRWVALPFESPELPGGRVSLVVDAPVGFDPEQAMVGLLVDEWNEVVPNRTEMTAVAYHYDEPGARAPQSILLAVTPDLSRESWDLDTLEAVVLETLELAKIRGVDLDHLPGVGHYLPALHFAQNISGQTFSPALVIDSQKE